jgi:hypothetical protein
MKQRQQKSTSPRTTRSFPVLPPSRSNPSFWTRATRKLWSAFHVAALSMLVLGSSLRILQFLLLRGQPQAEGIHLNAEKDDTPYRIIHTNLGWNHPTPHVGLKFGRTLFATELYHGIQQQKEYDSNGMAWLQPPPSSLPNRWVWPPWLQSSSSSLSLFTYVFMDVETCFEQIWPHYGGGLTANSDATGGRTRISSSGGIRRLVADQACPYVQHVLDHSPLFRKTTNRHARLVLFDCGYHGPTPPCFSRTANPGYMDDRVSLVSLSANPRQHWSSTHDIGLLPPAVTLSH